MCVRVCVYERRCVCVSEMSEGYPSYAPPLYPPIVISCLLFLLLGYIGEGLCWKYIAIRVIVIIYLWYVWGHIYF